jgi:integrase
MSFADLTIEYERGLLMKEKIPGEVKNAILKFVDEDLVLEGLSEVRRKNYIQRLRVASRWIPDKFLEPDKQSMNRIFIELNQPDPNKLGKTKYTESTKATYLKMLKKFYRKRLPKTKFEKLWENVKIPNPESTVTESDLITQSEMEKIMENCKNSRDRALFSLLFDSGCRIGEVLLMKIKNVQFDQYGGVIEVPWQGKTGYRHVRIVGDSIPYLRGWMDNHPRGNDMESPLFCNIADSIRGRAMTYDDVRMALNKTLKRAEITKRIHPHLFRHSRASALAGKLPEALLENQMGWIHGSRQSKTYVHISGKQQDHAVLKALGIESQEKDDEVKPKKCPRCSELNPSNGKKCRKCWLPLDVEEALKEQEKIEQVAKAAGKTFPEFEELLNSLDEQGLRDTLLFILKKAEKEHKTEAIAKNL